MEKRKDHFTNIFPGGACAIICLFLSISSVYSQKDLGELNDDGDPHKIYYLDTMYQDAVIPADVSYDYLILSAVGADGGYKRRESNPVKGKKNVKGGKGALVQAWFKIGNGSNEIPPGSTIRFMVGQKGQKISNAINGGAGGGGGTGIAYKGPRSHDKWKLLLVAGGGGGGSGDCCSSGEKGESGRPYQTGRHLPGYYDYSQVGVKPRYHRGGSAYGASNHDKYAKFQKEGWLEGPDEGEPTGSTSVLDHEPRGGWGFGAGGPGHKSQAWSGGGGGYVGGKGPAASKARAGESFINENMEVSGIFSQAMGKTDNPVDGLVTYQFIDQGSEIRFSANPEICMNVSGTNINSSKCAGRAHQRWFFVNNTIISELNAGKCLDLRDNNGNNGTNIRLWDCNGSNAQRWFYDGVTRQIRNLANRYKCLDLENNGNIHIWDCLNVSNQQWEIQTAVGTTPIAIGGNNRIKTIHLAKDENKCLASENTAGNPDNKTNIRLSDCKKNDKAQQWLFDGTFIRYYAHQNKCVDIAYRKIRNGTNIQLWDCSDSGAQQWVYDGITGTIRYKDQDECLVARGTNIELRDCDGSEDQRWGLRDANISFDPDKIRTIRRSIDRGKCLEVKKGRITNATNIQLGSCDADEVRQQWLYDGVYLKYNGDPTMCLDLRYGKTGNSTNIQLFTCHGGKNQRWIYDHNTEAIWYAHNWKKCVDLRGNNNADGTNIQLYECEKNNNAQEWVIE